MFKRKSQHLLLLLLPIIAMTITASNALAQPFDMVAHTTNNGGGFCSDGVLDINGSLAQIDAGSELVGGSFTLLGGFWSASDNPVIPGDINGDGEVNLLDVEPFVEAITSGEYSAAADINGDGFVNLLDVGPFIELLTGGG